MSRIICSISSLTDKVKYYTTILGKDFPDLHEKREPMAHFYAKHIIDRKMRFIPVDRDIIIDYNEIDPIASTHNTNSLIFDRMRLLKPLIYAQYVNPQEFCPISDYSFYKSLNDLYNRINLTGINRVEVSGELNHSELINRTIVNIEAQKNFVSLLNNIDYDGLDENQYFKFLELIKSKTVSIAVPTFEMDLFWHAHMLSPKIYQDDCYRNFGKLLRHNDKMPESELKNHYIATQNAWKSEFGSEILNNKKYNNRDDCGNCGSFITNYLLLNHIVYKNKNGHCSVNYDTNNAIDRNTDSISSCNSASSYSGSSGDRGRGRCGGGGCGGGGCGGD